VARRRHQDKDVEKVLVDAERHGWVVVVPTKGYWKARCRTILDEPGLARMAGRFRHRRSPL
jgi:hypothetical protein